MISGVPRPLFPLLLVAATGCFSGARPVKQMAAGDFMIGTNFNVPGTVGDPDVNAWLRYAPFSATDITAGALTTIPFAGELPGYGGLAEVRQHLHLSKGWRLVLDAQGEIYRLRLREERWTTHYRASFIPYFVVDSDKFTLYFGPKASWLTGLREIPSASGDDPIRAVPGAPGFIFAGVSLGAEDPSPPLFFSGLGGAFDVGVVIDPDTGDVVVPVSYSMSLYFGFL